MTDTTHEAPERIWACPDDEEWIVGNWDLASDGLLLEQEYVRADLVQAAVAAALREAAALFEQDALDMGAEDAPFYWKAEIDAKRILALITPDAQAALDRMVAQRIEELEAKLKTSEEIGRAFEEDAGQLRAKLAKAVEALRFYAWGNELRLQFKLPSEGPWGAGSTDFGKTARETLAELTGGKDD